MQVLSDNDGKKFLASHIPHRLCLLTTFRDRQSCFFQRQSKPDCDLLRCAKDAALISIRLLANFLGIKLVKKTGKIGFRNEIDSKQDPSDVFVNELGGRLVDQLAVEDEKLIEGLLRRADKELAHMTGTFDDEFNTAEKICDGIDLIESLLKNNLYDVRGEPFPKLIDERRIDATHWNFSEKHCREFKL